MYVRKKKNRSDSTSVVVVSKKSGRYEEVKSFGASTNPEEITQLYRQAMEWAHPKCGQLEIDFDDSKEREREESRRVIDNMNSVLINCSQLLLNRIYSTTLSVSLHSKSVSNTPARYLVADWGLPSTMLPRSTTASSMRASP